MERSFFKIAVATFKAALTILDPNLDTRLQAISEWASVIMSSQKKDDVDVRDLQRQIESSVERSANFLLRYLPHEAAGVDQGDLAIALDGIEDSISRASDLFSTGLVMSGYTPSDVVAILKPKVQQRWQSDLVPEGSQQIGTMILEAVCFQLVKWVQDMPPIQNQAAWRTLANSWALIRSTDQILLELHNTGLAQARDPNAIAYSQRRDIVSAYGKMELFGLPVESRYRKVPISVSYVTARGVFPDRAKSYPMPFDQSLRQLLGRSGSLVGSGLRLLLTGRAGSGKTTAAQWLAYQSGLGALEQIDWRFGKTIPFFVKLRDSLEDESSMPSDSQLLMSGQLREGLGPNWLQPLTGRYQPLIILDGWDELKVSNHGIAEAWVAALCERLPDAHIVVTSRPEGIADSEPFFRQLQYMRMTLVPLREPDKIQIIDRWYSGLRHNLLQIPDIDGHDLSISHSQLLRDINGPGLAEITDTPLMVSMLACLYATSRDRNPPSRQALYETVASSLIHLRDYRRNVNTGLWDELRLVQKERLFGQIAQRMIGDGTYTILAKPQIQPLGSSVENICREILPEFGQSAALARELTEALTNRSIVMQKVGDDEVEFVHRSFQEYFAGIAFARQSRLDDLFSLIERDESFYSLVPFAVQSGIDGVADKIIPWLLKRLNESDLSRRRRTLLVLLESLHVAASITPENRAATIAAVRELFPPQNMEEAVNLARLGDAATEYLSPETCAAEFDSYTIESLFLIGTRSALQMLKRFAQLRGSQNAEVLVAAWERSGDDTYADTVLRNVTTGLQLKVNSSETLEKVIQLQGAVKVSIKGVPLLKSSLEGLQDLPKLRELQVAQCRGGADLSSLAHLSQLQSIHLSDMPDLGHVVQLGGSRLHHLALMRVTAKRIEWDSLLHAVPNLRVLWLEEVLTWGSTDRFARPAIIPPSLLGDLPHLRTLAIQTPVTRETEASSSSLEFLPAARNLRKLRLFTAIGQNDLLAIEGLGALKSLDVVLGPAASSGEGIERMTKLESLAISDCSSQSACQRLGELPNLKYLAVSNSNLRGMGCVSLSQSLRALTMNNCTAYQSDYFMGPFVEYLVINGGQLEDLSFLRYFPRLREFKINDVTGLSYADGIRSVPDGCRVEISGVGLLDDTEIDLLRREHRCSVYYEPAEWWGEGQAVS